MIVKKNGCGDRLLLGGSMWTDFILFCFVSSWFQALSVFFLPNLCIGPCYFFYVFHDCIKNDLRFLKESLKERSNFSNLFLSAHQSLFLSLFWKFTFTKRWLLFFKLVTHFHEQKGCIYFSILIKIFMIAI